MEPENGPLEDYFPLQTRGVRLLVTTGETSLLLGMGH